MDQARFHFWFGSGANFWSGFWVVFGHGPDPELVPEPVQKPVPGQLSKPVARPAGLAACLPHRKGALFGCAFFFENPLLNHF